MNITYDTKAHAMYVYVKPKPENKVFAQQISDSIILDWDGENIIGIEILNVKEFRIEVMDNDAKGNRATNPESDPKV